MIVIIIITIIIIIIVVVSGAINCFLHYLRIEPISWSCGTRGVFLIRDGQKIS